MFALVMPNYCLIMFFTFFLFLFFVCVYVYKNATLFIHLNTFPFTDPLAFILCMLKMFNVTEKYKEMKKQLCNILQERIICFQFRSFNMVFILGISNIVHSNINSAHNILFTCISNNNQFKKIKQMNQSTGRSSYSALHEKI